MAHVTPAPPNSVKIVQITNAQSVYTITIYFITKSIKHTASLAILCFASSVIPMAHALSVWLGIIMSVGNVCSVLIRIVIFVMAMGFVLFVRITFMLGMEVVALAVILIAVFALLLMFAVTAWQGFILTKTAFANNAQQFIVNPALHKFAHYVNLYIT